MIVKEVTSKRKYYLVTFENERSFVIDPALIKKHCIEEGEDINFTELLDENEEFAYLFGLDHAFYLLGISQKTIREIKTKLFDKKVQTNAVNRIIRRLEELGYLNDRSFAEDYVSYKKESYHSKRAIKNKLKEKGISEDIISEALESYPDSDEYDYAEYFATKIAEKYDSLDYEKLRNKVYSRLASKGFSNSAIFYAADRIKDRYNESYSDRDTLMKSAARMNMRGMTREDIFQSLLKKSNSKGYEELLTDVLNELFE
ncbi:MAG: RecX family transcriptional regulator [Eubacteriaceae bacterium]|nr:RecX family transcriptional regulator [Eubacteriaceae bacterium]